MEESYYHTCGLLLLILFKLVSLLFFELIRHYETQCFPSLANKPHYTAVALAAASWASSSAILFSSSAKAGVLGAASEISLGVAVPSSSVTHPSVAVATHWMYLKRVPASARYGGGDHSWRRFSHSSSGIKTSMVRLSFWASIRIGSPFLTRAIGPPTWASGVMCPMQNPCVPPLNRPSVNRATSFPSPAPMMALVGVSISGKPGPPVGPS
mmetsp:Transcript_6387/g.15493  ORF Transcript_6387/g.15493 Transcript_6387/m.15493 type:complete len:211 (+) Transcript_6387:55-687(+)